MATQLTATIAQAPASDPASDSFADLAAHITEQRWSGAVKIDIPLVSYLNLGQEGMISLQAFCERVTRTRFQTVSSAEAFTASFIAVSPLMSVGASGAPISASTPDTGDTSVSKKSETKVPRPKNAFVIYRLANHTKIKEQNPGLHNNDISKIIGRMWASEDQEVKDEYKRQAEEEKRQHALAHPGYQYQPRKPSEKKKRMTKNKLAKVVPSFGSTDATTDGAILPAQQSEQSTVDTFLPPQQNNTLQITNLNDLSIALFDVGPGGAGDDRFLDQLALYNVQWPQVQANSVLGAPPSVFIATPLTHGDNVRSTPNEDVVDFDGAGLLGEWAHNSTTTVEETHTPDPNAEQSRQEKLDAEWSDFFDIEDGIPADFTPSADSQLLFNNID